MNSLDMNKTKENIAQRIMRFGRGALCSYGPSGLKRILWDKEYSGTKWDFAYHSETDCVYPHLQKHAAKGSILDLGCGMGNTANELAASAYQRYVGVDISDICLSKARIRSEENGRAGKNEFVRGDFLQFSTPEKFDVILFRESLYHVPMSKIESTLHHYAKNLKDKGVFIVRIATLDKDGTPKARPTAMVEIIEKAFDVVESRLYREVDSTVVVFRARRQS